ncbi:tail fiber domain-containing protein [Flavivirga eckloniae]|uniref:Peptidase S74 domain-containing protein n=1 Tax=Flavivirga eckloniae TaxID=1803846 RepID=A0A2K9PUJ9_9FLAO|nr:tail fiber domain-containing protein [Flavivirga eckloniae]AUP80217.1 hypothetical protein C1H87_16475 [Flavivirga eckloniae]
MKSTTYIVSSLLIIVSNMLFAQSNTLYGTRAGASLTTGSHNVFIGNHTGHENTTGSSNTFNGGLAGYNNITGNYNSFNGSFAGYKNTTGGFNTFNGSSAGYDNTTGDSNTFCGSFTGYNNTTGNYNTFNGSSAGYNNTTGHSNLFNGHAAGHQNTTGHSNTFNGRYAGYSNTKGFHNTYSGHNAGNTSRTGNFNTFIGSYAGNKNGSGSSNTFVGVSAGDSDAGSGNTYLGRASGSENIGDNNVFIGNDAGINVTNVDNKLYIQHGGINRTPLILGDFATGNIALGTPYMYNQYRLYIDGDAYTTGLWLRSDKKFKKDITTIPNALKAINALEGVTYQFKQTDKIKKSGIQLPVKQQYGLIAQELEKVFPDLVKESQDGYKAVNYQGLIPVLIEAIKEINQEKSELKEEIRNIKKAIEENDISHKPTNTDINENTAQLYQNIPNPAISETIIKYTTSPNTRSTSIFIFDLNGRQVKVFQNLKSGNGELMISKNKIPKGLYHYSLVLDGKIIDTKKMIIQ